MKTTRRGWITAVSSLIALPLVTKSGSATTEPPSERPRSLTDHFASLSYADGAAPQQGRELWEWERYPRVPLDLEELPFREEMALDTLHYFRAQNAASPTIAGAESELRDIRLARRIVSLLPSGRPLTFQYHAGSTPGGSRTILPTYLFQTLACQGTYLQGYCLDRLASRTFRLDRIVDLTPLA